MKASQRASVLIQAVQSEMQRLKLLDRSELSMLERARRTSPVTVGDSSVDVEIWAEPIAHDSDGQFVVLAGAWKKRWFGSTHHLLGFTVADDLAYIDLTPSELWHYD